MKDDEDIIVVGDGLSFNLTKSDTELFNDEDYVAQKLVHARRVEKKGKENWEILVDNEVALVLKGYRFIEKEKRFLRTLDGMKFLISQYKSGKKFVVGIKKELKRLKLKT